jgi:hypothetical protein
MWRLVTGLGRWLPVLLAAGACGGVVEGGSQDPDEGTPSNSPSGTGASSSQGTDNPDADTDLGDCTLGPTENRATDQQCAWVAEMRCYQTREMACNCACPRSRNSQCASGFEAGPDGHVWVACN